MSLAGLEATQEALGLRAAPASTLRRVRLLGVDVTDATTAEAVALMQRLVLAGDGRSRGAFIVNAHTLNLAWEHATYRAILNAGDVVFGDGVGVRLAARLRGVRVQDNLVGTDLLPAFFAAHLSSRYRYFLLGGTPGTAARAAVTLQQRLPGIRIAGTSHGFFAAEELPHVIASINAASPDVLLVAMGNPTQERWIHANLAALTVPLSIGVGGLFDHWAGTLTRAPRWVRRYGLEWLHILFQQPHKWRRYVLGNPKFVARALRDVAWRRRG